MPLTPGMKMGSYEILSALGAGGMGEVYRAHDAPLQRDVAIKVLRGDAAGIDALERFRREARAAGALNHPHICTIHDVGEYDGRPFLDIRAIGAALKVGALVEGSVRRSGNRLRVTAQLVNVADGYQLWSERYDRQMMDVFTTKM